MAVMGVGFFRPELTDQPTESRCALGPSDRPGIGEAVPYPTGPHPRMRRLLLTSRVRMLKTLTGPHGPNCSLILLAASLLAAAPAAFAQPLTARSMDASAGSVLQRHSWSPLASDAPKEISVCWLKDANGGTINSAARRATERVVRSTWEAVGNVKFTGWQPCNEYGARIRISANDGNDPPKLVAPGVAMYRNRSTFGQGANMELNLSFTGFGSSECKQLSALQCILAQAVNEFGHALGFDQRKSCTGKDPSYRQGIGKMSGSYCDPDWERNLQSLTPNEIDLVRFAYGVPAAQRTAAPNIANCSLVHATGGTLYATCFSNTGVSRSNPVGVRTYRRVSLPRFAQCTRGVTFNGANLICTPPPAPPPPPRPTGTFSKSCGRELIQGNTFYATCRRKNGKDRRTGLVDYHLCKPGTTANMDGFLVCDNSRQPPAGSYKNSCRRIYLIGTTLIAECRKRKNTYVTAWLRDAHKCVNGTVWNDKGKIRCRTN